MRRLRWFAVGLLLLLVLAVGTGWYVLQSEWFANYVRERVIQVASEATGARVELRRFRFDYSKLSVVLDGLVLHGSEPANAPALLSVKRVQVDLTLISLWRRQVDLRSLSVEEPRVYLEVRPDGTTNIPGPKKKRDSQGPPLEPLFQASIGRYAIRNGVLQVADRKTPFEATGRNLKADLTLDRVRKEYMTELALDPLNASYDGRKVEASIQAKAGLQPDRVRIDSLTLTTGKNRIQASGAVTQLRNPVVALNARGEVVIEELLAIAQAKAPLSGNGTVAGRLQYDAAAGVRFQGKVASSRVTYIYNWQRIDTALQSTVEFEKQEVRLPQFEARSLGGALTGSLVLKNGRDFNLNAQARNFPLQQLLRFAQTDLPYTSSISGPLTASGTLSPQFRATARGELTLSAGKQGPPLEGALNFDYDTTSGRLALRDSRLNLAGAEIELSGDLSNGIPVRATVTTNQALDALLNLAGPELAKDPPVRLLAGGSITVDGRIQGTTKDPTITANVQARNVQAQDQAIAFARSDLQLTRSRVALNGVELRMDGAEARGNASAALNDFKLTDTSALDARLQARVPDLAQLATRLKQKDLEGLAGAAQASLQLSGTRANPRATGTLQLQNLAYQGERLNALTADLNYANRLLDVKTGRTSFAGGMVQASVAYQHEPDRYNRGEVKFRLEADNVGLARIRTVSQRDSRLRGRIDVDMSGALQVADQINIIRVDGFGSLNQVRHTDMKPSNFKVQFASANNQLSMTAEGDLQGVPARASANTKLTGDYPTQGSASLGRITAETLQDLASSFNPTLRLPFSGYISASATFSGPLRKPEAMQADLTIPEVVARPNADGLSPEVAAKFELHNNGPIRIQYSNQVVTLQQLQVVDSAKSTELTGSGSIGLAKGAQNNLKLDGTLSLQQLRVFEPNLTASGTAAINVAVRGTLDQPSVQGQLKFDQAGFALDNVPNALENARGVITFDRNRANIETLRANTGGGEVQVSGFVGFGEPRLIYRLQAAATQVRIRQRGFSFTGNANAVLSGSSESSLLSGTVTVSRAGLAAEVDFASMMALLRQNTAVPGMEQSQLLRNMNLDIQVQSSPNLLFNTSLTNDVQTEIAMRLKGTAASPAVLGTVRLNSGEINFFGTRYTIERGTISFFNPVKIEPVLDLELTTVARGITVSINFSGPASRPNFTYRSDPPLQTDQILTLLLVGRDPNRNPALAARSPANQGGEDLFKAGAETLLGQAVTAPLSNRLNRLFGVTRFKIDPQLTGLNNIPQAVLTVEQQLSRDVTLTYVTNLTRTNQQLFRLQWDLSKRWSVIASRDENGVFAMDFQYRTSIQ